MVVPKDGKNDTGNVDITPRKTKSGQIALGSAKLMHETTESEQDDSQVRSIQVGAISNSSKTSSSENRSCPSS